MNIIQFDEMADRVVAALERACEDLKPEAVAHACFNYGIKSNNDWKAILGAQCRHNDKHFPLLRRS